MSIIANLIEEATADAIDRDRRFWIEREKMENGEDHEHVSTVGRASVETEHGTVTLYLLPRQSRIRAGKKFNNVKKFFLNDEVIARAKLAKLID